MSQLVALADAIHLQNRPVPKAPDGRYDYQVKAATDTDKSADEQHSYLWRAIQKVEEDARFFKVFKLDSFTPAFNKALFSKGAIDDRTGILTMVLSYLCNLPQGSTVEKDLNDKVMTLLYNTLAHPPATFLGTNGDGSNLVLAPAPPAVPPFGSGSSSGWSNPEVQVQNGSANGKPAQSSSTPTAPRFPYAFRSADGSYNNVLTPNLGRAGLPYARSVQAKHPLPANMLPDPGLVFDSLLRADNFQGHPGGNSALTFAFASLVTHSLFRTDRSDQTINNTSSYLDLSVLYGINQAQQDSVRDKQGGRGKLWPDAFAEDRLILVPPASTALLVVFSRNHNYICDMLLKINERKHWQDPPPQDETKRALQDEEIFQTAKLINCGHFMAMIFGDYVAGFLGLGRDGNSWSMNPFDPIKDENGEFVGRGEGNHCSVEFNLLYRWHATTAANDIQWTEDLFSKLFMTTNFDSITLGQLGPAVGRAWTTFVDPDPRTRTFAGLKRGHDGSFSDDDLARVLHDATESLAGAYRARGTPSILKIIEIMAIEQGRAWGVCSMNEFRAFLGLKKFDDFEEWCSDKDVAEAARKLYGHIDNLELYPGLQAEDCMKLGPGSGICCGYTMTRAILGDAISLVRGDRFYTTDYTPYNLTSWGYQDCARDPNNGAFGAALPKLLFRHLPRHYTPTSVYALFPFFTPETTRGNLTKLGLADKYDFARPKPLPIPKVVDTIAGIRHVFNDSKTFRTTYPTMQMLTEEYGFFLVFDGDQKEKHDRDKAWAWHSLFNNGDKATMDGFVKFYTDTTRKMIKNWSYTIPGVPGTRVDIVRNVINLVSVHWVADYLFEIDLKTKENPKGMFTEQEAYDMLNILFTCVFINVLPEHYWALTSGACQVAQILNGLMEKSVAQFAPSNPIAGLFSSLTTLFKPRKPYYDFLTRLAAAGRPVNEMVAEISGLSTGSSMNYAHAIAQVVDFYLDDARSAERKEIQRLITKDDDASMELLRGYVHEAQRLNPQFAALFRVAASSATIPLGDGKSVSVQQGDILFNSFRNAHLNPTDFPDPLKVNPRRPWSSYQLQGGPGMHQCMGYDFVAHTAPAVLKVIFGLKNLRRAESPAGEMASFMLNTYGTDNKMYLDNVGNFGPWPGSLTVVYDP